MATGITEKTRNVVLFSVSLAAVMSLVFLLASSITEGNSFGSNAEMKSGPVLKEMDECIENNILLQQKLVLLQQLDADYTAAITDTVHKGRIDSLQTIITDEEDKFINALNEAEVEAVKFQDKSIKINFEKMLAAFRSTAESRKVLSLLRNIAAAKGATMAPGEKELINLQNDLNEKIRRIAVLETSLSRFNNVKQVPPESNENAVVLQQRIADLESNLAALNVKNSNLKQDNERLQKANTEAIKAAGSVEQVFREKNTLLQERINELNAEIQLVKVDCNLNRVDASQIISTAKQRKQLLNEASDILTALSASADVGISRKVKEKIIKLNKVAANYRE